MRYFGAMNETGHVRVLSGGEVIQRGCQADACPKTGMIDAKNDAAASMIHHQTHAATLEVDRWLVHLMTR